MEAKLYIKNMVCNRCKMAVTAELEKLGLQVTNISLGEVDLDEMPSANVLQRLDQSLQALGFEIIDSRKSRLIEQIKTEVIRLIHYSNDELKMNLSGHLAQKLNYDYNYLSNLFSEVEATTIEKYFIAQKIEKVKELLMYDELTLAEIAYQLGYSSAAYLSNQFKKQTGLTPSFYKSLKENRRRNLDDL